MARGVLRRPRIPLLAEPVVALGRATAEALLAALLRASPRTALVIALREQDLGLLETAGQSPFAVGSRIATHST
ncbi:hypothetical protein [Streptomyces achromogenes]|uniref:hypothetical protein n=1 Tax=Streptomyces achromogenes TaxID=67255 RepID=UPI0036A433D2